MIRKCNNCKTKIEFKTFYKQMLKDRYTYTCTECGAVHKATILSIIVNSILFIVPFVSLMGKSKLFLFSIGWIFLYLLAIQPLVIQYKQKKN